MDRTELEQLGDRAADGAVRAVGWIDQAGELLGDQGKSLAREFRRHAAASKRLRAAIDRPMCVGVFGPSQSGKSFLVSALARKVGTRLVADFGEQQLDFLDAIDPGGGRESTGLVTRFTIKKQTTPAGYPVQIRTLSQVDLVKILANTYYLDCDHSEREPIDPAAIAERLADVRSSAGTTPVDGLSEDDMYDLQDYFDKSFGASNGVESIRRFRDAYWPEVETLAPRLPLARRARLFSILWGDVPQFTRIYEKLCAALASLNFAPEAFCTIAALVPKVEQTVPKSIIDVLTLRGLGEDGGEKLTVVTRDGRKADIARCEVTALTAELQISIRDKPWDFFDHTDLLDFPGARSREGIKNVDAYLAEGPDQLWGLFLRGKVAYLFERYCAERELTAMLLCIADSNQEVRTLPGMVNDWIEATHGKTVDDRSKQATALFLVLTKFDRELTKKEQAGEEGMRWTTRMHASLTDFFGKQHRWPSKWDTSGPFKNTFWLRNPNFPQKEFFNYAKSADGLDAESEIRPDQQPHLSALKSGFVANAAVEAHFADPAAAWDAALTLNDGGVTYLAGKLAPVCRPALKLAQIEGRLEALCADMRSRLAPFYVSDDIEAEVAKKREQAERLAEWLLGVVESRRFGELVGDLLVTEDAMREVYHRMDRGKLTAPPPEPEAAAAEAPPSGARSKLRAAVFKSAKTDAPAAATKAAPAKPAAAAPQFLPEARVFSAAALERWVAQLQELAADEDARAYYESREGELGQLAHELATGVRSVVASGAASPPGARVSLRDELAQAVNEMIRFQIKGATRGELPARLATLLVNAFVASLGFDREPLDARPKAGEEERPVFRPRPEITAPPALHEDAPRFEEDYSVDWVVALMEMMTASVRRRGGASVDTAKNSALGALLALWTPADDA